MIHAWVPCHRGLSRLPEGASVGEARWIDVLDATPEDAAILKSLGFDIPTLEDMEEIEISNRVYREGGTDYMTAMVPGTAIDGQNRLMPVTFILSASQLVTVRHHVPRPFETFPQRADLSATGVGSADRIFLGLIEEIVGRFADILEGVGRDVDETTSQVFHDTVSSDAELRGALTRMGLKSEVMARMRIALLSLERVLSFYQSTVDEHQGEAERLRQFARTLNRDIQSLEVHADFLGGRIGLAVDATLGLINLAQNNTVRVLSVVAALFLPPTLIASIFGMNFQHMPELSWRFGYPMALGLMLLSAGVIWWLAKRRKWLDSGTRKAKRRSR